LAVGEDDGRPSPPGRYGVVVVGSGPGGLQASYWLGRLGIEHAVLSADDAPGGMFRRFPLFERLISWTHDAPQAERETRAYEARDQNSLIAEEPELRGLVAARMASGRRRPARACRSATAAGGRRPGGTNPASCSRRATASTAAARRSSRSG
jgi:thioredoxin reductase